MGGVQLLIAPLVGLYRFSSLDGAIAEVNRSRFGLQAGLFTRDLGRNTGFFGIRCDARLFSGDERGQTFVEAAIDPALVRQPSEFRGVRGGDEATVVSYGSSSTAKSRISFGILFRNVGDSA